MTQANWTDERVEQLKTLWTEGLSASQIARTIGGVTRNAVIGKVHRLGLTGRVAPAQPEHPRQPAAVQQRPAVAAAHPEEPPRPQTEEEPQALDDGHFATVLTITDHMCRWPIGDPSDGEFHFCGRKVKPGSPYCEAHARKAYQPQQSARRSERDKDKMTG